ncbi:MAG: hypothetical protein WCA11_03600 [Terracidiphilus sp.]
MHAGIDPVVVEALCVGTIGAVAAAVGGTATMKAARRVFGSRTLAEQGLIPVLSGRLSMIVAARDRMSDPLHLRFTLSDPAVTLIQIELANQLDNGAKIARCVKEAPRVFAAAVEPKAVQRWYNANPYWERSTKKLPIQVFFRSHGQATYRTIWVRMSPCTMSSTGLLHLSDFAWFLEGPCSRAIPRLVPTPSRMRTDGL